MYTTQWVKFIYKQYEWVKFRISDISSMRSVKKLVFYFGEDILIGEYYVRTSTQLIFQVYNQAFSEVSISAANSPMAVLGSMTGTATASSPSPSLTATKNVPPRCT